MKENIIYDLHKHMKNAYVLFIMLKTKKRLLTDYIVSNFYVRYINC